MPGWFGALMYCQSGDFTNLIKSAQAKNKVRSQSFIHRIRVSDAIKPFFAQLGKFFLGLPLIFLMRRASEEHAAFTLLSQAGISKAVNSKFALVASPRYTLTVSNTLS